MNEPRVASIHVGKVAPLGPNGVPSGFEKHGVSSAVNVVPLGIVGDEQADLRVHGGPDKACLCVYVSSLRGVAARLSATYQSAGGRRPRRESIDRRYDARQPTLHDLQPRG